MIAILSVLKKYFYYYYRWFFVAVVQQCFVFFRNESVFYCSKHRKCWSILFFLIFLPYINSGFNGRKLTATISVLTALIPTEKHITKIRFQLNNLPTKMIRKIPKNKIKYRNSSKQYTAMHIRLYIINFEIESKAEADQFKKKHHINWFEYTAKVAPKKYRIMVNVQLRLTWT